MSGSARQPLNADSPISVTPEGMLTDVRDWQPENVRSAIFVKLDGKWMDVNWRQPENAAYSMLVTELGMSSETRYVEENASKAIRLRPVLGKLIVLRPELLNVRSGISSIVEGQSTVSMYAP